MSNSSTESRRSGSGDGPRRSGNRRRRNNNSNRGDDGGGGGRREGGGRRDGRQRGGGRREGGGQRRRSGGRPPRREPKPPPLTWWQKLLKSIGLYKPKPAPKRPARQQDEGARPAPKSGTRVAKTKTGAESSEPRREPKPVESTRLYLGNLSYDASEYDLEDLFKGVGAVRNIEIVYNRNTHKSKGYGFIEMGSLDEAKRAVEVLHDQPFMGRKLIVSGAKSKGPNDDDRDTDQDREADSDPDTDSEEAA